MTHVERIDDGPAGAPPHLHEGRAGPASLARRMRHRRALVVTATFALSAGVYWISRDAAGEMGARTLAIIVIAALFWATEVLPLFATAFVVVGLEILVLATDGGLAAQLTALQLRMGLPPGDPGPPLDAAVFLAPFASDIVVLFLGAFLLAAAVRKHRVDEVIAGRILQPFTRTPLRLLYAVLGITAFLSMWMSNTATAAMMVALVGTIVRRLPERAPFRMALLLAVPFGANIGGIGTPIGTPPNAIAYGVLNQAGYDITFFAWMLVAIPLAAVLLAITGLVLYAWFAPGAPFDVRMTAAGVPLTRLARRTLAILGVAIALWMSGDLHGLAPGVVALLAAAALTAVGVLDRDDVDSIDWNILILMWGALSLSVAAEASGLMARAAAFDMAALPGGAWTVGIVVAAVAVGLSTVMSNTATAALLVPAALALAVPGHEQVAMLAALACSFGMALPVSTPPNAIAYATGAIPLQVLLRTGGVISALALALLLLGYRVVLPFAF